MEQSNLIPCPFCKGEARIIKWLHGFWPIADHRGACPINDMRPPEFAFYVTEQAARDAWNMRNGTVQNGRS